MPVRPRRLYGCPYGFHDRPYGRTAMRTDRTAARPAPVPGEHGTPGRTGTPGKHGHHRNHPRHRGSWKPQ
ncbi:hypothetical protein [Streptomyces rimosus]|uniref:hypothetical protein n=1 Tax=Streptomyces rimosus TaxID=1927 RepID=UPI00133140D7|nr:hypothetical protein [Streptomyces rimosus]